MDPASIVQDTESTRFWSQMDGQTQRQMNEAKPLYPTSNFDASECMTKLALLLLSKISLWHWVSIEKHARTNGENILKIAISWP